MADAADTAVPHVHRSLLPRIDLAQLQSYNLQVNIPPRLAGTKSSIVVVSNQQAEAEAKLEATLNGATPSDSGTPRLPEMGSPSSKSPGRKEDGFGRLQPAFKAGFPHGRQVTPRDVAEKRKKQLTDAKAYYSTNNVFTTKVVAEKQKQQTAASSAAAAVEATAKALPEPDVLGWTLDGGTAGNRATATGRGGELLKSSSFKTAVITSRVLPVEQQESADRLFHKFMDESLKVASGSTRSKLQQQQQQQQPMQDSLQSSKARGTMGGKAMGGTGKGSLPDAASLSLQQGMGSGGGAGGSMGGAAAEAEEDEESCLASMLLVMPSPEPPASRTAKHQFAPAQAPEPKMITLAIAPEQQLVAQALERNANAAATIAAAAGLTTMMLQNSSSAAAAFGNAGVLAAADMAFRPNTGGELNLSSPSPTYSAVRRSGRMSSTAGASSPGARLPGTALMQLVTGQLSPVRQRVLVEASAQRVRRGADVLRSSWPLTNQAFPTGAEPYSTIKALQGVQGPTYPLAPPLGPTSTYYAVAADKVLAGAATVQQQGDRMNSWNAPACVSRSDGPRSRAASPATVARSPSFGADAVASGVRGVKRRASSCSMNWNPEATGGSAAAAAAAAATLTPDGLADAQQQQQQAQQQQQTDGNGPEAEGTALSADVTVTAAPVATAGHTLEQLMALEDALQQYPAPEDIHTLVARCPPGAEDVVPSYTWGAVGRLQRRYDAQAAFAPTVFDLSYALSGRRDVGPLLAAMPRWQQLLHLRLRNNSWDDWAVQELVKALLQPACKQIVGLDLAYNCLGPDSTLLLAPLLHDPPAPSLTVGLDKSLGGHALLTHLVLAGNPIGDAGAEVLLKLVGSGDCPLKLLDISRCDVTSKCAATLKQVLEGARQLTVLRLGWNQLGPTGARALAEGLKYSSSLRQLHLPWSGITDSGASHIAAAMESNSSVRLLDMSGCQVSAATCLVLAETLANNKVLEKLVLQENPLGRAGAQRLLKAVHAGTLKHVDIAGCGFLPPHNNPNNAANKSASLTTASNAPGSASGNAGKGDGKGKGDAKAGAKGGAKADKADTASATPTPRELGPGCEGFNPKDANGAYVLNLALPGEFQVAVELFKLAEEYGAETWKVATLDGVAFSIKGLTRHQLPRQGLLKLEFESNHKPNVEAVALTEEEFDSMWVSLVDADCLAEAAMALQEDDCDEAPKAGGLATRMGAMQTGATAGRYGLGAGGSMPNGWMLSRAATRARGTLHPQDRPDSGQSVNILTLDDRPSPPGTAGGLAQQRCSSGSSSGSTRPDSRLAGRPIWSRDSAMSHTTCMTAFDQSKVGQSMLGERVPGSGHVQWVTDDWKRGLLGVLVDDCYFTARQAAEVIAAFNYGSDKVDAAVKLFGRVVDPEHFAAEVYPWLNAWQAQACDERLGLLRHFSPLNPTGSYDLLLCHPAHYMVAVRLVELFQQQYLDGLCDYPHHVPFAYATLNGRDLSADLLKDPMKIKIPREGFLKVGFVDLRCQPAGVTPLSKEAFAVLLRMLTSQEKLSAAALSQAVDDASVATKVNVVNRFEGWGTEHPFSGKVGVLRRAADGASVVVKDTDGLVAALRYLALDHYLTCAQLVELLQLLPPDPTPGQSTAAAPVAAAATRPTSQPGRRGSVAGGTTSEAGGVGDRSSTGGARRASVTNYRSSYGGDVGADLPPTSLNIPIHSYRVEVATAFFCRVVDRDNSWVDVMRSLTPGQQVLLAHRLGYANVFNPARPGLFYQLRMSRPDDHQIAWRLLRMAQTAQHSCFQRFAVDGVQKAIVQGPSLWPIMRGHAAEGENPTVVLDFEFVWPDNVKRHWAAVTIQAAWRSYLTRKRAAAAGMKTIKPASRPSSSTRRPFTAATPQLPSSQENPAVSSAAYYFSVTGATRPNTAAHSFTPAKWEMYGHGKQSHGGHSGPPTHRSMAGGLASFNHRGAESFVHRVPEKSLLGGHMADRSTGGGAAGARSRAPVTWGDDVAEAAAPGERPPATAGRPSSPLKHAAAS